MQVQLPANGSLFVVMRRPVSDKYAFDDARGIPPFDTIRNTWTVTFDSTKGGPARPVVFEQLKDWSIDNDAAIKYYSGTAVYTTTYDSGFISNGTRIWLDVSKVANLAEIYVNGKSCGVVWTPPYMVDISGAFHKGKNEIKIAVTNTWFNRLKGDQLLPEKDRITKTNAPFWSKDKPLQPAGLLGPVILRLETEF